MNGHGITTIQTSSHAAEALRPVAGPFASSLFALGIHRPVTPHHGEFTMTRRHGIFGWAAAAVMAIAVAVMFVTSQAAAVAEVD